MLVLAFVAFLVFGIVLVLIGANQAELAAALGLDLEASGQLAAALSLGLGAGVLASGPLVDRGPRRPLFVGASAGAAVALLGFDGAMGFPRALAQVAALGLCVGTYETLLNTVVAERYGAEAARPLTWVHIGATVGAMAGAPALALLTDLSGWTAGFRATGLAFLALGAWGLAAPLGDARRARAGAEGDVGGRIGADIVPFALVAACYVGVETALTLFAVPWSRDALDLDESRGVAAISAFWLGLLAGRVHFAWRPRRVGPGRLVASGALAAALLALAVAARWPQPELVLASVGFALGAVFPVFVALTTLRFPGARGTATGLVTGAGALGGLVVPWLAGAAGDRAGIGAAFLGLAVCCVLLAASAALSWRSRQRPS